MRRDRADVFCATEDGVRGRRALDWRLVDEIVPPSAWEAKVRERALAVASSSFGGLDLLVVNSGGPPPDQGTTSGREPGTSLVRHFPDSAVGNPFPRVSTRIGFQCHAGTHSHRG
jgi:enoyl-CoA hydratase/carnithine racemase